MSTRNLYWMETADRVNNGDFRILGETEDGELLVPSKTRPEWWDRRFNSRNPTHWQFWLRSRLTNRIAFLESS